MTDYLDSAARVRRSLLSGGGVRGLLGGASMGQFGDSGASGPFFIKTGSPNSDTSGSMGESPTKQYLRDAVMTASPEQLQLMLYDGALRFARQGGESVKEGRFEDAYGALSRSQRIVLEMQQGLRYEVAPELCDRMSAIYLYIYRRLIDGCVNKDVSAIDEAIRLLEFERETWMMLINKLSSERADAGAGMVAARVPAGVNSKLNSDTDLDGGSDDATSLCVEG